MGWLGRERSSSSSLAQEAETHLDRLDKRNKKKDGLGPIGLWPRWPAPPPRPTRDKRSKKKGGICAAGARTRDHALLHLPPEPLRCESFSEENRYAGKVRCSSALACN